MNFRLRRAGSASGGRVRRVAPAVFPASKWLGALGGGSARAGASLLLCGLLLGAPLAAQDVTHPRDMGLAESTFEMPDSNQFRVGFENGMMAWVVPDFSIPIVRFTAFVRAGYGDDKIGGVAEVIAWIMRTRGPCWLGRQSLDEALDAIAATLVVNQRSELTEVTLTAPMEDGERALRLFSGIVRQACIDVDAVNEFKAMYSGTSDPQYDASLAGAYRMFQEVVFNGHRYRPGVLPEEAAVLNIDDVDDWYRDNFSSANTTLAVSGAFQPDEMYRLLDFRFSDWEERRLPNFSRSGRPRSPDSTTSHVYEVEKLQTWIVMGQTMDPMLPDDQIRFDVMNYILAGGHFDTRLFRATRDRFGLTNDASGYFDSGMRGPSTYTFRTSGRPSVADSLTQIIVREIERMQNEEVTAEELAIAKGALIDGVFPMKFENGHMLARTFAEEWARFITLNYLAGYQEMVEDVDAGDVRRAARDIRLDQLTLAVIRSN